MADRVEAGSRHRKRTARSAATRRVALGLTLSLLAAAAAGAQEGLRVTYEIDRSRAPQTRIVGEVRNEMAGDALEVSVTAEALDARGKVVASGISYVDSRIPRGDARRFTAVIPPAPNAVRFRVSATATRPGSLGQQAP